MVDLYQASNKETEKIETNLVNSANSIDLTHLDTSDFFFGRNKGESDHLLEMEMSTLIKTLIIMPQLLSY